MLAPLHFLKDPGSLRKSQVDRPLILRRPGLKAKTKANVCQEKFVVNVEKSQVDLGFYVSYVRQHHLHLKSSGTWLQY